jgi:hypothetical protein
MTAAYTFGTRTGPNRDKSQFRGAGPTGLKESRFGRSLKKAVKVADVAAEALTMNSSCGLAAQLDNPSCPRG